MVLFKYCIILFSLFDQEGEILVTLLFVYSVKKKLNAVRDDD